nr:MAG TPA: hypothetical protein [Caudoviricetes sp.]
MISFCPSYKLFNKQSHLYKIVNKTNFIDIKKVANSNYAALPLSY